MSTLTDAVEHLEQGEWQAAHEIVQDDAGPLACWAHGIVHLMEGDLDNAGYWYRRAGRPVPEARWASGAERDRAISAEIAALRSRVLPPPRGS